jgi:hypothetical protein
LLRVPVRRVVRVQQKRRRLIRLMRDAAVIRITARLAARRLIVRRVIVRRVILERHGHRRLRLTAVHRLAQRVTQAGVQQRRGAVQARRDVRQAQAVQYMAVPSAKTHKITGRRRCCRYGNCRLFVFWF